MDKLTYTTETTPDGLRYFFESSNGDKKNSESGNLP